MTPEIAEAIEAACSVGIKTDIHTVGNAARRVPPATMRARIKEFLRNVPEDISVRELLDEL